MGDTRTSLREFQSNLSKMAHQPVLGHTWIALRIGNQGWLVAAGDMAEVMASPSISSIGRMSRGIRGIVATRGKVSTVLDMSLLLSEMPSPAAETGWLVLVSPNFMPGVALWWPELVGMMPSPGFTPIKSQVPEFSSQALQDENGIIWQVLDVPRLLASVQPQAAPLSTAKGAL